MAAGGPVDTYPKTATATVVGGKTKITVEKKSIGRYSIEDVTNACTGLKHLINDIEVAATNMGQEGSMSDKKYAELIENLGGAHTELRGTLQILEA